MEYFVPRLAEQVPELGELPSGFVEERGDQGPPRSSERCYKEHLQAGPPDPLQRGIRDIMVYRDENTHDNRIVEI